MMTTGVRDVKLNEQETGSGDREWTKIPRDWARRWGWFIESRHQVVVWILFPVTPAASHLRWLSVILGIFRLRRQNLTVRLHNMYYTTLHYTPTGRCCGHWKIQSSLSHTRDLVLLFQNKFPGAWCGARFMNLRKKFATHLEVMSWGRS